MHRCLLSAGLLGLATTAVLVGCPREHQGSTAAGSGGAASTGTGGAACPDVPTQIFAPRCGIAGCHGPSNPMQQLDLASPGVAARVVGKPSVECAGVLASPAHPESSVLYTKLLAAPPCGARMPFLKMPLPADEIACVKDWIAAQGTGGAGGGGGAVTGGGGGLPATCGDEIRDGDETDIDCGGDCSPCPAGEGCAVSSDCESLVCTGGKCAAATCTNHVQNGIETGVDCGALCPPCPEGEGCAGPTDCETFSCSNGLCIAPSCTDLAKNGMETGVDCGGPMCGPCPGGQGCAAPSDCASMVCASSVCAASCTDGVKDGAEIEVDCGGGTCPGCPPGTPCSGPGDCSSKICSSGTCAAPTCSDMVQNGGETDTDCGGPACPPCALGQHCGVGADCATGGCTGATCVTTLLISEVRTRGHDGNGSADELLELYNPGTTLVVANTAWAAYHRSAQGSCGGTGTGNKVFQGSGQIVPPHGHLLIVGAAYQGTTAADATMLGLPPAGSLADAGSISVVFGNVVVDTVCFYYDATTLSNLTTCASPYVCAGMPVSNLPHDGTTQASSMVNAGFERRPGGALGNGQSTGDNAADFVSIAPDQPQDLASPPVP